LRSTRQRNHRAGRSAFSLRSPGRKRGAASLALEDIVSILVARCPRQVFFFVEGIEKAGAFAKVTESGLEQASML
jgi:hypothetical protein